ncbi:MAG: BON domain-containing protein [Bdellovibrionales bacterium]|nr:BON domain-containing protein [Bdellovibrionales bacterium]
MNRGNRNRDKDKHNLNDQGFRQNHSGRSRFPGGEWGESSEFGRNTSYRESDSFDKSREKPFDMDNYYSGRQFSVGGVDFDRDERDDEINNHEFNRSRFAEPYSQTYGRRDGGFSGKGPKGYKRSDEKIHEEVCEALYRNPSVDASDIDVKVKEGLVTLSGTVDSRFTKREAENCIEHLQGVMDVQNELRLQGKNMNQGTEFGTGENRPEH